MVSATRPHRGRFIKNYTILNLDGEPVLVKGRWLLSIRDFRSWCFNSTNSRYQFGSILHRCAMIPESGHFFWYLHYKGKWICTVIEGSTLYLVGFILTSVGKDLKVREMSDKGELKNYIKGATKMKEWYGNYSYPELVQVGHGALRSGFRGMYKYLSGEGPQPSVKDLLQCCDIFVIHLPEAGRYDSLALCSIASRFVEGGRVGTRQIFKVQKWSKDCSSALSAVIVIEEKSEKQKMKYGRKEKNTGPKSVAAPEAHKKLRQKMTKAELESILADIRLFYRPNSDHKTVDLSSMPVQLREGELVGDFPLDIDQSDMDFLIQPVNNIPHDGCKYVNKIWICKGPGFIDKSENDVAGSSASDTNACYVANPSSYMTPDHSQNLYQVPQQPTHMFVPPSTPANSQPSSDPAPVSQQTVKTFTPANPPGLKNPEQYQQVNTLGSLLYTAAANQPYSSEPDALYQGGGKLVSFHPQSPAHGAQVATSEVHIHNLMIEQSLVSRSTEFEAAMQNGDKSSLHALCEKKSQESLSDDERETWSFLRVMFEDGDVARTKLLAHLGFEPPQAPTVNSTDELSKTLEDTLDLDHGTPTENTDAQFLVDNGDDFFNIPQPSEPSVPEKTIFTNGEQKEQEMPADVLSDPSIDRSIQHALVIGDYKGAVNQCLAANRMADALVIAHAGGTALWESTRNHYLKNSISSYLKVVTAVVGNDLTSFVSTWPLRSWKETLALLCTFAQKEEWTVLCDTLASRLLSVGDTLAATLCYICAGNIDKTVEIWSRNLNSEDGGKTYVDLLQDLMEKTITLALATGHKRFSASLSKLVENYAEMLASQGLLKSAMEYLKLLGSDERSHELAILRDRIVFSTEANDAAGSSASNTNASYVANQSSYMTPDPSQNLYQLSSGPAPVSQQTVKTFTPANPPGLKNPEQYQQANTLDSPLYTAAANQPYSSGPAAPYQSGPPTTYHQPRSPAQYQTAAQVPPFGASAPVPGTVPNQMFTPSVGMNSTSRFMPPSNQGFVQRPGLSPLQQSSPTQAQPAPPAPPPTVQTADTSSVSAELRPVIATLTRLFDETSKALGGSQATQAKKSEIEDNSRKIGALFAKLNSGGISPNVSSKLIQLCSALDSSDTATAMHLQVLLTTSDWDECNFWPAALKHMIKTRQNFRM